MSANTGIFLVQQRRDADNFGDLPADQHGDEGFSPDAFAFFAEFQIAPDEIADDGGVRLIKIRRIVTGFRAASHAHAELHAELEKSGGAQIVLVFVPDDDVLRRHARVKQPVNRRGDDGGPRAAEHSGGGENLDADDVLRRDEAAPGGGDRGLAGEIREAAIQHHLHPRGVRLKIRSGV